MQCKTPGCAWFTNLVLTTVLLSTLHTSQTLSQLLPLPRITKQTELSGLSCVHCPHFNLQFLSPFLQSLPATKETHRCILKGRHQQPSVLLLPHLFPSLSSFQPSRSSLPIRLQQLFHEPSWFSSSRSLCAIPPPTSERPCRPRNSPLATSPGLSHPPF